MDVLTKVTVCEVRQFFDAKTGKWLSSNCCPGDEVTFILNRDNGLGPDVASSDIPQEMIDRLEYPGFDMIQPPGY